MSSLVKYRLNDVDGKLVTEDEAKNIIKQGYLYDSLKPKQRKIFLDVIHYIKNDKNALVPENESTARNLFLRGKYSLNDNLPLMKISLIDENHSYIHLDEAIRHILLHGYNLAYFETESGGICDTKHYKSVMKNCPKDALAIGIINWSDDAQSSKSVKVKGSTWIKTISFLPPSDNEVDSFFYLKPICIGDADANHECVERVFQQDLKKLKDPENSSNIMYSTFLKREIKVYADVFVSVKDQPERRKVNGLMLGNSNTGARWGHSTSIKKFVQELPCCDSCLELLKKKEEISKCNTCYQWDTTLIPGSFILTSKNLKQCVENVHTKVDNGVWNKKQCFNEMDKFCINKKTQQKIYDNAMIRKTLKEEEKDASSRIGSLLQSESVMNNNTFKKYEGPAAWETEINRHIDAPMHLLFLGLAKTSFQTIDNVLKVHHVFHQFEQKTRKHFNDMTKLSIDWCVLVKKNSGNFTNWISENYVAIARLSIWIYAQIKDIKINSKETDELNKMKKHEMIEWLKDRDLETDGVSSELKERIVNKITTKQDRNNKIFAIVEPLVLSLYGLLSRAMTDKVDEKLVRETKRYSLF